MLNKLISEKDWSAQEVSHIFLGLQAQEALRETISINCRLEEILHNIITVKDKVILTRRLALQRYRERLTDAVHPTLLTVTLFEWLRLWDWPKLRFRPHALLRVINYYSRYANNSMSPTFLDYC